MPAIDMDIVLEHKCCQGRRGRKRCICNCHDVRVTDYSKFAPTIADFGHRVLRWHVRTDDRRQRTVGAIVQQGSGYAVCFEGMKGAQVIVEQPWYGVGILSAWSQTGREHIA